MPQSTQSLIQKALKMVGGLVSFAVVLMKDAVAASKEIMAAGSLHKMYTKILGSKGFNRVTNHYELTVEQIIKMVDSGKLNMVKNRDVVLDVDQMRRIVQWLYNQPDVPRDAIIIFKTADGQLILIDGFQRVTSIVIHSHGLLDVWIKESDFEQIVQVANEVAARDMNDDEEDEDADAEEVPSEGYMFINPIDVIKKEKKSRFMDFSAEPGEPSAKRQRTASKPIVKAYVDIIRKAISNGTLKFAPQTDESLYVEEQLAEIFMQVVFPVIQLEETPNGWNEESARAWLIQSGLHKSFTTTFEFCVITGTQLSQHIKDITCQMWPFKDKYSLMGVRGLYFGIVTKAYMILTGADYVPVNAEAMRDFYILQMYELRVDDALLTNLAHALGIMNESTKKYKLTGDQATLALAALSTFEVDIDTVMTTIKAGPAALRKRGYVESEIAPWTDAKKSGNIARMWKSFCLLNGVEVEGNEQSVDTS